MTGPERVVVVGASAAGLAAADGLREAGFDGSITVLGAERHHPYDRPSLSKSLLVHKGAPELIELRSADRISESITSCPCSLSRRTEATIHVSQVFSSRS